MLYPCLQQESTVVLNRLPPAPLTDRVDAADNHTVWERKQMG